MTNFYVNQAGEYLGAYDGAEPPEGAIEVLLPPDDARQIWNGNVWRAVPEAIPDSVTARQFKMQLVVSGLKTAVDGWVAQQDELVQVAYEYSGNFVRTEPMMQAGFTELGFTEDQRNAFFLAASKL